MSTQNPSDRNPEKNQGQELPKAQAGMPSMRTADGREIAVPPEGSLGLLAMGYKGIMLWREARAKSGWTAKQAGAHAREIAKEQEARRKETEARIKEARTQKGDSAGDPAKPKK